MVTIVEEKRMNRGENAATKRWGKITLEELVGQRERLELLIQRFRAMELVIQAFNFNEEEIRIDGITKYERGIKQLQLYIENVERGIKAHKHGEVY